MRKLLVAVMAAASVVVYRRWKASEAEKSVWKASTDRLS
ncbi:DLW-39 family protein [Arthrobacter rhombi]|nr:MULTISPECIES: DLW-39 family protein [Micrococcaceae]